jgi:hypothetical protein
MCCVSIGSAHQRPWRTKGKKNGSIQKPDQTKPGDGVSVNQIISAQPFLMEHSQNSFCVCDTLKSC